MKIFNKPLKGCKVLASKNHFVGTQYEKPENTFLGIVHKIDNNILTLKKHNGNTDYLIWRFNEYAVLNGKREIVGYKYNYTIKFSA